MWNQWKSVLIVSMVGECLTIAAAIIAICRGLSLIFLFFTLVLPVLLAFDALLYFVLLKLRPPDAERKLVMFAPYWAWGIKRENIERFVSGHTSFRSHWIGSCVFTIAFGVFCLIGALTMNANPR
ncbi:MAG: hypothetical protein JWN70_3507 [Planctomycetaceae bacterium]|nr:hypothetical protein [Planctomycetaceae bacterium]